MANNFTPQKSLRSNVIKSALKSYIVPAFVRKYQVVAIRALWSIENLHENTIWGTRRELDELLYRKEEIVAYVSCITALNVRNCAQKRKRTVEKDNSDVSSESEEELEIQKEDKISRPGLSFWLVLDSPNYALEKYERDLSKLFMSSKLNLQSCKAVKGRGKVSYNIKN